MHVPAGEHPIMFNLVCVQQQIIQLIPRTFVMKYHHRDFSRLLYV